MKEIIITRETILRFDYLFESEAIILYTILVYHKLNKISEEKYKGQIRSLRDGNLQKYKHTYHSDLNDKWYNNEPAKTVFYEILESCVTNPVPIDGEDIIKGIMDWQGCNYNMAINLFTSLYITPLFNNWIPEDREDSLQRRFKIIVPFDTRAIFYGGGYCDYCGASNRGEYSKKGLEKTICSYMHNTKKGNLSKIPKTEELKNFSKILFI